MTWEMLALSYIQNNGQQGPKTFPVWAVECEHRPPVLGEVASDIAGTN